MAKTPKNGPPLVFKTGRPAAWTRERIERLSRQEITQLQANAVRLGEAELNELCQAVLKETPARGRPGKNGALRGGQPRLVSRNAAFEARGVWLQDMRTSWSGIRKADGAVVFALWSESVTSEQGGCSCLLWSPNTDGGRAWSDTSAGRERLAHCKTALERGSAEGLLVQGERLEGSLPEERAQTILGVDPQTVIAFRVEQRGAEYWAVWGRAVSAAVEQGPEPQAVL